MTMKIHSGKVDKTFLTETEVIIKERQHQVEELVSSSPKESPNKNKYDFNKMLNKNWEVN
jgi:hypothetical protein